MLARQRREVVVAVEEDHELRPVAEELLAEEGELLE
jgi:hypothetical protein